MHRNALPLLLLLACTPAEEIEPAAAGGTTRAAGPAEEVRGQDGVHFSATTAVLESFPVHLHTTVEATNRGGSPATLVFPDGCTVLLRAWREDGTADEPAWDQAGTTACTMAVQRVTLQPGESRSFETRTDAREILGDSLPDGSYRLAAYLRPATGAVQVPAGTVPLAVQRD
jgi:hypothetical protein